MEKTLWLSWERHRRNQSLADELNINLFEIDYGHLNSIVRYLFSIMATVVLLIKKKPQIIFVQNPSMLLALFVLLFSKVFNKKTIVDAHNAGVLFEHPNFYIRQIGQTVNEVVLKNADMILVTNNTLASIVNEKGGTTFVIPDPFPKFDRLKKINLKGEKNIFFICTFSGDEPYLEVIKSAKFINKKDYIYISGGFKKSLLPQDVPDNIIFTGYVSEEKYINLMFSSDIIIDLTTREDCLVCGAYEAVAMGKPLILSNTQCLKNYFDIAALYTDNQHEIIGTNIKLARKQLNRLSQNSKIYYLYKKGEWEKTKYKLEMFIQKTLND